MKNVIIIPAGTIKRVHVNQAVIKANIGAQDPEPVITVKCRLNKKAANVYGYEVKVQGESTTIYRPQKPLSCGAHVWIESRAEVWVLTDPRGEWPT